MENLEFKIDGPILKEGVPIPLAISALGNFQSIVDKTYLVVAEANRITAQERERFYLRATEFRTGSLLTYFEIALQGIQLGLPLVSAYGPQNIWDLTKDTFSFLKTVCAAVKKGETPHYEFKNNGNVDLHVGDMHHHYHGAVYQIGQLALPSYQELAHLIGKNKLTEISAGVRNSELKDIYLGKSDKEAFDIPAQIRKEVTELKCEVFDFNKYKNVGKLSVALAGQEIPPGEYNFSIFGSQDNVNYIYSMLKSEVVLHCLIEEAVSPFGGKDIVKLHIAGVGS